MNLGGGDNADSLPGITVHYKLRFKKLCLITVLCPLVALIICLITGYIFQPNDIHETHCRVYNIVPSISAITGISPQRYLWRISVAFHIGPRIIIAAVHRAYNLNAIAAKAEHGAKQIAERWLNLAFWFEVVETASLCGVTYISNRENYPVHEKLFITFMVSSLLHMLACIKGVEYTAKIKDDLARASKGLNMKKNLFLLSIVSTIGLVGFFMQHRFLCHRMAFSMFALCEYILAIANMVFHITVILDFPTEYLVVAQGLKNIKPGYVHKLE